MITFFNFLLILHIGGGAVGLITGTLAAGVKKGSKLHKLCGLAFFWGMLVASIAALILSNLPNHENIFLFAVGGFTLFMICSGYRIIHLKKRIKLTANPFTFLDSLIFLFGISFGSFLLLLGFNRIINGISFGVVPSVFGLISVGFAWQDYKVISRKAEIKQVWMRNHIIRMMGALIASFTAFLVVNFQIQPNWVLWLSPTLIGSILIVTFIRKYVPVKKNKANR